MHKTYRFCFFDDGVAHATAVLVLHFPSDAAAGEEAQSLLSASTMSRIEVWRGTRRVCHRTRLGFQGDGRRAGYALRM